MKKTAFIIMLGLIALVSCSENQEDTRKDAKNIKYSSSLLPIDDVKNQLVVDVKNSEGEQYAENEGIFHVPQGSEYVIELRTDLNPSVLNIMAGSKEEDAYFAFIDLTMKDADDFIKQNDCPMQTYYYAGVKRGARIYADKSVAGREPGANISDLMSITVPYCCLLQLTYPDYQVYQDYSNDKNYILFSDYFKEGMALPTVDQFFVNFVESPAEQYDEITYTIEIPFECEYMRKIIFGQDYKEEYYEQGLVERNENRMLKGSVTIHFDK